MALKSCLVYGQLPIAILLLICAIIAPASAEHYFDIDPSPSPEATTSLICPNENPSDCYPAIFQPTVHFQRIRPDQSLPPGLHVRLNIQTGEKEARLNVPEESVGDEPEPRSEAIMIIEESPETAESALGILSEEDNPLHLRLQDTPKQAKHAKPYSPPRPAAPVDAHEANLYEAALLTLRSKLEVIGAIGVSFDQDAADAFEMLTDLSHSIEWGVTICRNSDLVLPLLNSIFKTEGYDNPDLRSAALLLLATAIQNNPDALRALWSLDHAFEDGRDLVLRTMDSVESDSLLFEGRQIPVNLVTREIFFLSQICAHENRIHIYLRIKPGYDDTPVEAFPSLWRLFSISQGRETEGSIKLQHRIANFVEDHAEDAASFYMEGYEEADELSVHQMRATQSLQPWCKVLHSKVLKYGEDDSFGFHMAEQEMSRVLKLYAGKGCDVVNDDDAQKEL